VSYAADPVEHRLVAALGDPDKRKRGKRKSTSPTARTLAECRKRGFTAQVVERFNPHAKVRVDLFGVIDVVAMGNGTIVGIQACSGTDHARRRAKILAEPRAKQWVECGGHLELWSWSQRGAAGKRKLWTLRVETYASMQCSVAEGEP
jgi:hypothetical protein